MRPNGSVSKTDVARKTRRILGRTATDNRDAVVGPGNAQNEITVAAGFDINLLVGARQGDVLTACAVEVSKAGRTGVYDVSVSNQRGEAVAVFRGRSHTFKGKPVVAGVALALHRRAEDRPALFQGEWE